MLLDQIDWDKDKEGILLSFSGAAYTLGQITSIGLPKTVQEDGANGLKVQGADNGYDMSKSSSFGFAPLMAATWNKKLLHEIGNAFGQESIQTESTDGTVLQSTYIVLNSMDVYSNTIRKILC